MGDFNGRIGQVIRAFEKYPAGDINTRMIVREQLAAERAEGFKQGYGEGMYDASEAERSEREHAAASDPEASGRWYEDWAPVRRDSAGNLILKHKPTGALYRVLPKEET